jgi:transcription antitermination factor NusG
MADELLKRQSIERFLPLVRVLSRWQDRRKWIDRPVFPGYLFVRVCSKEMAAVLNTKGVVKVLGGGGSRYAVVADAEVENVRRVVQSGVDVDPYPYLEPGQSIQIKRGPLKGVEGTLLRKSRRFFVAVSVEVLGQAVLAEVSAEDISVV